MTKNNLNKNQVESLSNNNYNSSISEQKNIESKLEKYKAIFDNSAEGIAYITNTGKIIDVNKTFINCTGLSILHKDIIGKHVFSIAKQFIAAKNINNTLKIVKHLLSGKDIDSFELITKNKKTLRISPRFIEKQGGIVIIIRDITETKKITKALHESEELHKKIIQNQGEGMGIVNTNEIFIYSNPAAHEIFGVPLGTLNGRNVFEFLDEKGKKKILNETKKRISGKRSTYEFNIIRPDGEERTILLTASPQSNNNGEIVSTFGIYRDITQRRKTEIALQNSEKSLRKAQQLSKVASWEIDLINKKFSCSDEFYNIYEIEKQEIKSSTEIINKYVHPDDKKFFKLSENRIPKNEDLTSIEFRIITPNKNTKWIHSSNPEIIYKNKKAVKLIGINQDITERKNAELKLSQKTTELTVLLDLIPAFVYFKDFNLNYISVNKALAKISKYSENEIPGKNDLGIWDKETAKKYRDNDKKILDIGKPKYNIIEKVQRKDGTTFWSSTSKVPYYNNKNILKGLIGITWDISEIKGNEEKLKQAIKEAKNANRLKSDFLANMSHEIRTPMNAILGFSEILKSKLSNFPEYSSFINGIYNNGQNLLQLINDILDLSKIEANKLEIQKGTVNLSKIITEFKNIFSLQIKEKKINFNINIDEDLPDVLRLDQTRIRQILFNLIGNAVKFTNQGEIRVSVKFRNNLTLENKIDLFFEIKDTGIGIPIDQQKEIFEAFVQQDSQSTRKYKGTGLGLTITKRLVEMMDGNISVSSIPNVGSSFKIFLKNVDIPNINLKGVNNITENVNRNIIFDKETILLVEDSESNRQIIKLFLSAHNLNVIEARNGKIALDIARKIKPSLILMDIQMPEMTGDISAKLIKENSELKSIPIIALTAYTITDQINKYKDLFNYYILKPVSKNKLISVLSKYLPYKTTINNQENLESINYLAEIEKIQNFDSQLIYEIKSTIIPVFLIVSKGISIDEILNFSNQLIKLGKKYNISPLLDYAKDLQAATNEFRFGEIETLLNLFSNISNVIIGKK